MRCAPFREQPRDRDRRVVVDAETGRRPRHRVMQPAGNVDRVLSSLLPDSARSCHRRTCDESARLVHALEDRVVRRAQPVSQIRAQWWSPGPAYRIEVLRVVHQGEQLIVGQLGAGDGYGRAVQHTHRPRERHREHDPHRRERVSGAEVVCRERVVPDDPDGIASRAAAKSRSGSRTVSWSGFTPGRRRARASGRAPPRARRAGRRARHGFPAREWRRSSYLRVR